jgi:hypothetical protein
MDAYLKLWTLAGRSGSGKLIEEGRDSPRVSAQPDNEDVVRARTRNLQLDSVFDRIWSACLWLREVLLFQMERIVGVEQTAALVGNLLLPRSKSTMFGFCCHGPRPEVGEIHAYLAT